MQKSSMNLKTEQTLMNFSLTLLKIYVVLKVYKESKFQVNPNKLQIPDVENKTEIKHHVCFSRNRLPSAVADVFIPDSSTCV